MWEGDAFEGENLQVLYIVDLVSLVAFENFEWLLMTWAVIYINFILYKTTLKQNIKQWTFRW